MTVSLCSVDILKMPISVVLTEVTAEGLNI
jgi:hypothetical protein